MARGKKTNKEALKKSQKAAKESRRRLVNKFREETREKFFKGNENISDDRLHRRRQQELAELRFIRTRMKPVEGSSNLLQKRDPEGIGLAEFRRRNAMQYGPTMSEVLGDIGYGIGSIAKGFAEKGSPVIQLLKGLYQKGKDYFTQPSGIEEVVAQAPGGISEGQPIKTGPQFPYNFETIIKPKPEPLQPSEMSEEQFMESYPELYSQNPLFRQQEYKPFRVSDMDMSGVVASERGQNLIGQLQNLQNLANQYNLNKIQFDPFNPNQIGYKDQFMFNNTPVNYNVGIGNQGIEGGLSFAFKNGGSVDKYAGLGYKLK